MPRHYDDDGDSHFGDDMEEKAVSFGEKMKMQEEARAARIKNLMERYDCTSEDAVRFIDLREEGHSAYAAAVMAGLNDPHY